MKNNYIRTVFVVGNFREEFLNETNGTKIYNDHPSKKSIEYIIQGISNLGYDVKYFGGINELVQAYKHGTSFSRSVLFFNASDGLVQRNRKAQSAILLELLGVKYIGSDATACLIVANKYFTKLALKEVSIKSPEGILVTSIDDIKVINLIYPLVVKPNRDGSSIGISDKNFITSSHELYSIVSELLPKYKELILEEYIEGFEVTNFIIGNSGNYQFNEVIATGVDNNYFFHDKLIGIEEKANGHRNQILGENILPTALIQEIKNNSEKIFSFLGLQDFARIDYRITEKHEIYFLEANTNPVISDSSEIGLICKLKNLEPKQIFSILIDTAMLRYSL